MYGASPSWDVQTPKYLAGAGRQQVLFNCLIALTWLALVQYVCSAVWNGLSHLVEFLT